jgi:hypothetical protein
MRGFDLEDTNAVEPTEVHLSRIDVPFLELTWFFIKASLAMALAFSVTSWLWVMIGTGMVTLSAGLLFLIGVPRLFAAPTAAIAPPAILAPAPEPVPVPEPVVEVAPEPAAPVAPAPPVPVVAPTPPPPPVPVGSQVDPNQEATEAAQRAELERARRERAR